MSEPVVSVVIPAFNAAAFIGQAIDSVLAQTWPHREILVVNDGSTDDTPDRLRTYGDAIRVIDKPNGGLSSARNRGIEEASGRYVTFLDADDRWLPEKLAQQIAVMESEMGIGFCSTVAQVVDPEGRRLNIWPCPDIQGSLLETLFRQNGAIPGSGSGVMVRRALFETVGLFDEALRSLEDIDMWMRLAAIADYRCIDEPLTIIVKHPDSMSRNLAVMRESAERVMRKNRHLLPREAQGTFWRCGYAAMLADYAKGEYRAGRKGLALLLLLRGLMWCPLGQARSHIGLILAMLGNRQL